MTLIAVTALFIGTCVGFVLARRFLLRTLVGLILALIAVFIFAAMSPSERLPGNDFILLVISYLFVPSMAAGLVGGGVIAWLFRDRPEKS